jgi:hypothetical protein
MLLYKYIQQFELPNEIITLQHEKSNIRYIYFIWLMLVWVDP